MQRRLPGVMTRPNQRRRTESPGVGRPEAGSASGRQASSPPAINSGGFCEERGDYFRTELEFPFAALGSSVLHMGTCGARSSPAHVLVWESRAANPQVELGSHTG